LLILRKEVREVVGELVTTPFEVHAVIVREVRLLSNWRSKADRDPSLQLAEHRCAVLVLHQNVLNLHLLFELVEFFNSELIDPPNDGLVDIRANVLVQGLREIRKSK